MRARLRPDGRWEAREQIGGKRWSGYGRTREDAESALEARLLQSEKPPDSSNLISFWETSYAPTIQRHSPKWIQQTEWAKGHCRPLHLEPLEDLTRAQIQALLNAKARHLSRSSVGHIRKVLFAVLNLAEADRLIPFNPVRHVKLAPPTKQERLAKQNKPVLTPEELFRLIDLARWKKSRALAPLVLGGILGLGFDEMRELTPNHFRKKGLLVVPGTKNDYRLRELPIDPRLLKMIGSLTFPVVAKYDVAVGNAISRLSIPMGLGRVSRHILRHTCATGLQSCLCPEDVRAAILGHSRRGMTAHYSHDPSESIRLYLGKWVDRVLESGGVNGGVKRTGKTG